MGMGDIIGIYGRASMADDFASYLINHAPFAIFVIASGSPFVD
jgi:hypothetical protein